MHKSRNADDRLAQLGLGNCGQPMSEAFRSGLAALGYKEGDNIRVLYRYADGHAERLSALASELVSLGAMVIVTNGGSSIQATALAAQPATIKVASLRVYPRLAGHPWGHKAALWVIHRDAGAHGAANPDKVAAVP